MISKALRYTARGFRSSPGVIGLVVLTLALGIGGTTAVFGVVDGVLINPLPYPDPDRLVEVWTEQTPGGQRTPGLGPETIDALREHSEVFAAVEAYQFGAVTLTGAGEPILVSGPRITPGLFRTLGVVPRRGRLFADDDATTQAGVVLISERLWTTRFGRADDVIGRRLVVDGEPQVIVGVLPSRFALPERNAEVWRPLVLNRSPAFRGRVQTIVRLRPDVTRPAIGGPLSAISAELQESGVLARDRRLVVEDLLQQRYGRQYATALCVMLGAVGLVLLIACVNVTSVLLARAAARQGEFALMGALGASRFQVIAQVMLESLVIAALGSIAGLLIARLLLTTLLDLLPPQMVLLATMTSLDWRAVVVAVGVSTLACVGVGVLPALRVARADVIEGLHGRASVTHDRDNERWQSRLVVAQLAMVLVLLTSAGLLLRSFVRLVNVEPGFESDNLAVFEIQLPDGRHQAPGASVALFEQLKQLVTGVAGVTSVSFSQGVPPSGGAFSFDIQPEAEGRPRIDATGLSLPFTTIAPDYFGTMGIPLLAGRTFARDDPDEVVIVNDVLARRFWGGESPVGRRFRIDSQQPWRTVVGVAGDVKQMGLNDPMGDGMELYVPYSRNTAARFFTLLVRTNGRQPAVVQQVKERLWTLDPNIPVYAAGTMEQRLAESVARPRFLLSLTTTFALFSLVMASVGVYGAAAYWVARRRRELGVRMALGATRAAVVRLVIGRAARLAAWGCAIGVAISLVATRLLDSLLFQTGAREPAVFMLVAVLQLGLVLAACYMPASRASRVDPATVLRTE